MKVSSFLFYCNFLFFLIKLICNLIAGEVMDNKTTIFNVKELRQELILMTINEVIEALEFKGYNATNQLVGYLLSGDSKYITTFNHSRAKLMQFDRSEVLMSLINAYLGR